MSAPSGARAPLVGLVLVSAAFFLVRVLAAYSVGFGDSEALYACYALHPQPAYLDHPGLIGLLARAIGGGAAPTPFDAHLVTAVASTLVPWAVAGAAYACGATWRGALWAAIATAAAPEIAVGLYGMTPDLPLAFAWLGALGLAAWGLRAPPSSNRAAVSLLFAGVLCGVACVAKASGALLVLSLLLTYASPPARAHAKTWWPWLGLAAAALVVAPVVKFELDAGLPMLRHRLVETQAGAGVSLRNLGAVVGGQLVYVSPVLLFAAFVAGRDLLADEDGPVKRLLLASFAVPLAALLTLSFWSPVAEPHWLAPPLLALALHGARATAAFSRRLATSAIATGLAFAVAAHAWVLVPAAARLRPETVDARIDIANELFGWPRAVAKVRDVVDQARIADPLDVPVVVAPHWTLCAQLHAALDRDVPVGCDGPLRDDFDGWLPREAWQRSDAIVFVTDDRYPTALDVVFPHRRAAQVWEVPFVRGGRVVRTFRIALLLPRAMG